MRFLLYNIRYGAGVGSRFHLPIPYAGYLKRSTENLDNILDFIDSLHPDIIGLVEVDSGSFRTENTCQAELIANRLGFNYVVESKYGNDSLVQKMPLLSKQSNAVLARETILSSRFHYFDQGVKRLVIEATLPYLTLFLVHLSLTFRNRQQQLVRLSRLVRQVQGPVIVAGDFNVLWGDWELELFREATGLASANNPGLPSHPSRAPRRQLDYILHSPTIEVSGFHLPEVQYSDHIPLVCDFILPKKDRDPPRPPGR